MQQLHHFQAVDLQIQFPLEVHPQLQKTYEYLLKNGVKFNAPPQLPPDGNAKVTFCEDPDGTPIELVQVINSD